MKNILILVPVFFLAVGSVCFGQVPAVDARSVQARVMENRNWNSSPKVPVTNVRIVDERLNNKQPDDGLQEIPFGADIVASANITQFLSALKSPVPGVPIFEEFAKSKNVDELIMKASLAASGTCNLHDVVRLLGKPDRKNTVSTESVCQWDIGTEQILTIRFISGFPYNCDLQEVTTKGIAKDRLAEMRKEVLDWLSRWEVEYWDIFTSERQKTYLAESEAVREWKTMAGRTVMGKLVGVERDVIIIEREGGTEDVKPSKIEAFRLSLRDRCIVEAYCDKNKLKVPELNPVKKIKAGASVAMVTSVFGPIVVRSVDATSGKETTLTGIKAIKIPQNRSQYHEWYFGDSTTGFQCFKVYFDDEKVHKIVLVEKGILSPRQTASEAGNWYEHWE